VVRERDAELTGHERGIACGVEEMVEAGEQLVARGVVERESASDARAQREQLGRAHTLGESCVTRKDDAKELLGVEVFARENAQLAENGGECLLRFVDDEDGPASSRRDVVGPA
jgi:hypothetical protein